MMLKATMSLYGHITGFRVRVVTNFFWQVTNVSITFTVTSENTILENIAKKNTY